MYNNDDLPWSSLVCVTGDDGWKRDRQQAGSDGGSLARYHNTHYVCDIIILYSNRDHGDGGGDSKTVARFRVPVRHDDGIVWRAGLKKDTRELRLRRRRGGDREMIVG